MSDTIDPGWDTNYFAVGDVVRRNLVRGSVWPQDLVVTAINGKTFTLGLAPVLSSTATNHLGPSRPNRRARRQAKAIARRAK